SQKLSTSIDPPSSSGSTPITHIASTYSAPIIFASGFVPDALSSLLLPLQLILNSSGPPWTCSDHSPLLILPSPPHLGPFQVPSYQCRKSCPPSKDSLSVAEPPWLAEPDTLRVLTWEDQITLQQFCNGDLKDFGQSYMDDQEVVFQGNTTYDAWPKGYVLLGQTKPIKEEEHDLHSPLRDGHAGTGQSPADSQRETGHGANSPTNWSEKRFVGGGDSG
ncbi:hypothetical protein C0989_004136, partial [Termitomyces sp. Mn162]